MKNPLPVYYLLLPVILLSITTTASSDFFNTDDNAYAIYSDSSETINFDGKQCLKRLPKIQSSLESLLQVSHFDELKKNFRYYYLMTKMGSTQKYFVSNNQTLLDTLKNPVLNRELAINKLTLKLRDSFIGALEDSRAGFVREPFNLIQGPAGLSTYTEYLETFSAFPSQKLIDISTLEQKSQSVINLLINNSEHDNRLSQLDSASTASFLYKKLGLLPENYQFWRNHFFNTGILFNKKDSALSQMATFVSYLIVKNQYNEVCEELITRKKCTNDAQGFCSSLHAPLERLMEKASEQLIITMEAWLAAPQDVQPCFDAGCYSRVWYLWAKLWVKPVQKTHDTYRAGRMIGWYQLASKNSDRAEKAIELFKAYIKNDACREYAGL